jgi:hypothetical protein
VGWALQKTVSLAQKQSSHNPTKPFAVSPKEQNTIAEYLDSIARAEPERFKRGFVGLEMRERSDLNAIAGTDGRGTIYLTPEPARLLASALEKLKKSDRLTLEEEQACITLEHEILHNEAAGFALLRQESVPSNVMELLNEITARQTYVRHIVPFGVKENYQNVLRKEGNGYPLLIANFDELWRRIGNGDMPNREMQQMLLQKDYSALLQTFAVLLEKRTNVPLLKIKRILTLLNRRHEDFKEDMNVIL